MDFYGLFYSEITLWKGLRPFLILDNKLCYKKKPGIIKKNKNLIEKEIFEGQIICNEIIESHCGFFRIGFPVFCSEFIAFLVKIEMQQKIFLKKIPNEYIKK